MADRAVSAQQLNAELTQNFFNSVINNLRSQAESNRQMTEELQGQRERQREATQALTQESVGAYIGLCKLHVLLLPGYRGAGRQAGPGGPEESSAVTRRTVVPLERPGLRARPFSCSEPFEPERSKKSIVVSEE